MRKTLAALLVACLHLPSSALADEALGRVRAVYYETARGVLVEARVARPGAIRWADVAVGTGSVLVQLPPGMEARVGDVVALRPGEPKSSELARVLPTSVASRALAAEQSSAGR